MCPYKQRDQVAANEGITYLGLYGELDRLDQILRQHRPCHFRRDHVLDIHVNSVIGVVQSPISRRFQREFEGELHGSVRHFAGRCDLDLVAHELNGLQRTIERFE